jgi:hypothetical protein
MATEARRRSNASPGSPGGNMEKSRCTVVSVLRAGDAK